MCLLSEQSGEENENLCSRYSFSDIYLYIPTNLPSNVCFYLYRVSQMPNDPKRTHPRSRNAETSERKRTVTKTSPQPMLSALINYIVQAKCLRKNKSEGKRQRANTRSCLFVIRRMFMYRMNEKKRKRERVSDSAALGIKPNENIPNSICRNIFIHKNHQLYQVENFFSLVPFPKFPNPGNFVRLEIQYTFSHIEKSVLEKYFENLRNSKFVRAFFSVIFYTYKFLFF